MLDRTVLPSGVSGCHAVREAAFLSLTLQAVCHKSPLIAASQKLLEPTQRDSSV